MKGKYMCVILVFLLFGTVAATAQSHDAVFADTTMGMTEGEVRIKHPNLRFESGNEYVSQGNAVVTRFSIAPDIGLYKVESTMQDDGDESFGAFIGAIVDHIAAKHGEPRRYDNFVTVFLWDIEYGNTFDDPNTASIGIYLFGRQVLVSKFFLNAREVKD